jgi:hypothetical protein
MIRVYLDWNVISNLKKPEFKEIKDFIDKHKKHLQFLYSPAHFSDLMKSYSNDNNLFDVDLETLGYLSEKHLIRWGKDGVEPLFATPKEYFESIRNEEDIFSLMDMEKIFKELDDSTQEYGLGDIVKKMKSIFQTLPMGIDITEENQDVLKKMFPNIKNNSTMWDLMKEVGPFSRKLLQDGDYYKDFRKTLSEKGFKLESNSGNWNEDEVIKNIDDFLIGLGTKMTYLEYVQTSFKHKKEPINLYEYFTNAYLMLDMIGYKTDKLPKPTDNMKNIQADGEHSFYAAHCDYFVAIDKKLIIKSKVLYNEFKISTIIIKPNELISELEKVIDLSPRNINFIEEAFSFCNVDSLVESYPISKDNEIEAYVYKLPKLYFNFFNYLVYRNYPKEGGVVFVFKKEFKNFSKFLFYTEAEQLIDSLTEYFGYDNKDELELKKKEFVYEDLNTIFNWHFEGGMIRLENDEETNRPILIYIIVPSKKKDEENTNNGS